MSTRQQLIVMFVALSTAFGLHAPATGQHTGGASGDDTDVLDDGGRSGAATEEELHRRVERLEILVQELARQRRTGGEAPPVADNRRISERDRLGRPEQFQPFRLPTDVRQRQLRSTREDSRAAGLDTDQDDQDLDGLSDQEEAQIGSEPANPDTDGDALLDGWEAFGVNGIDLPALGASPLRKDIFIKWTLWRGRARQTDLVLTMKSSMP
jgi:hypothetical protein